MHIGAKIGEKLSKNMEKGAAKVAKSVYNALLTLLPRNQKCQDFFTTNVCFDQDRIRATAPRRPLCLCAKGESWVGWAKI